MRIPKRFSNVPTEAFLAEILAFETESGHTFFFRGVKPPARLNTAWEATPIQGLSLRKPKVFLSHWWGGHFRDFMQVVENVRKDRCLGIHDGIWICTFVTRSQQLRENDGRTSYH
eukprot:s3634_g1.t1